MSGLNSGVVVQNGRSFSDEEIEQIRKTVQWFPRLSRMELACTVCEHLSWYSASGAPRQRACLKLLETLEARGEIGLPKTRPYRRKKAYSRLEVTERTREGSPLEGRLCDYDAVELQVVSDKEEQGLWNEYVERYHPLGYRWTFGYRQKYFIVSGSRRLGCVYLSGVAKALRIRDRWIGWSERRRQENHQWVINNSRYLIFPWVRIPHLASHVLGRLARQAGPDWEARYGFRPLLMETFVDPERYTGTCYRAAGWEMLGRTTGKGLVQPGKSYTTSVKLFFAKPLNRNFRRLLCGATLPGRDME